jgi:hypothetical protein
MHASVSGTCTACVCVSARARARTQYAACVRASVHVCLWGQDLLQLELGASIDDSIHTLHHLQPVLARQRSFVTILTFLALVTDR